MSSSNREMAKPMRGMRDMLPKDVALRQSIISIIEGVYGSYGFTRIETPVVEKFNLLSSGEGGDNEKQTFRILRRNLKIDDVKTIASLDDLVDGGLRFDLTIPLARYYANNQANLPSPFKAFQIGNVWRAERPQRGRYRQFIQCDVDVIGDETGLAERELILATSEALSKIGFSNFKVRINDRRILRGIAEYCGCSERDFDAVFVIIDKLDKIGLDGVEKELFTKGIEGGVSKKLMDFLRDVSGNTDNLDQFSMLPKAVDGNVVSELKKIMDSVREQSGGNFQIVFDPTLVRGMGYYTGPIFEIEDENFPVSIAGGGRYDKMIGKYSGKDIPACGFSIGFERIMDLLSNDSSSFDEQVEKVALLFDEQLVGLNFVLSEAQKLRSSGAIVYTQRCRKNMKKQLDELVALGYNSFCLVQSESAKLEFKSLQ